MTKTTWINASAFGLPWSGLMIINNLIIKDGRTLNMIVSILVGGLAVGFLFASVATI